MIKKYNKFNRLVCNCGCELPATWLCTGFDYDPRKPNGIGEPFTDEPCCESAARYLSESSSDFGHPFKQVKILTETKRLKNAN